MIGMEFKFHHRSRTVNVRQSPDEWTNHQGFPPFSSIMEETLHRGVVTYGGGMPLYSWVARSTLELLAEGKVSLSEGERLLNYVEAMF